MANGDVFAASSSGVTQNNYFDIRPAVAGREVVVHNICHGTDADLYYFDGTNNILISQQTGSGAWMSMFLHSTYTQYYRVKNTNVANNNMACDGIVTKEAV